MRLSGTKVGAVNQYKGFGDVLYDKGASRPTLDLNFANNESLDDSITGKNLVSFTRASSGTYVDGDGVIRTSPVNLLTYSEELDQWTKYNGASVTPNVITAPDGTFTADLIDVTASSVAQVVTAFAAAPSTTYTVSFWAKSITTTDSLYLYRTLGGSVIINITNEWQRYTSTYTTEASNPYGNVLFLNTGGSTNQYYVWGVQVEEGSTATDYIPTTSTISGAPRFDHDPATGESLGLLIEEAKTNVLTYSEDFSNAAWTVNNSTAALSTVDNPFGVSQVWRLTENAGTGTKTFNQAVSTNPTSATISIFVKPDGRNWFFLQGSAVGGTSIPVGDRRVWFDLVNKTVGTVGSSFSNAQVQEFSNGWLRLSAFLDVSGTGNTLTNAVYALANGDGVDSYTGDGSSGVYIWGAQREDSVSFPTSYIPTDGATVTRAADVAEIVGNDFGTFNLAQYSENVTGWNIKSNVDVSLDQETAPDGTRTADKVAENTSTVEHYVEERVTSGVSGVYTHSVFVKAAGRTSVYMRPVHVGESSNTSSCIFDLATGTAGTPTGLSSNPTIEAYPNGWYRIALSVTLTGANTAHGLRLHVYNGSALNYQGDGTSGYYVWGAQVEKSDVVTPYVKSDVTFTSRASTATYYDVNGVIQTAAVDEARTAAYLPDENGNFISAGQLLLEDASTNQFTYSNSASNGETWNNVGGGFNLTAGYSDPAGGTDAIGASDSDNAISGTFLQRTNLLNTAAGTTLTYSIWLKPVDAPVGNIFINLFSNGTTDSITGQFEVSGTEIISASTGGTGNPFSASFQKFPDGWYRCSVTGVVSTVDMSDVRARINLGNYQRVQDTLRFYWYGAQLEESPYATSYIPTSGSTATRAADVSSSSSNAFGNSFYNQSEGTVFAEAQTNASATSNNAYASIWHLDRPSSTGGWDNGFFAHVAASPYDKLFAVRGGSADVRIVSTNTVTIGSFFKGVYAGSNADNSVIIALNGTLGASAAIGLGTNINILNIGRDNTISAYNKYLNGHIKRLTYFNTRLPDATLQNITT